MLTILRIHGNMALKQVLPLVYSATMPEGDGNSIGRSVGAEVNGVVENRNDLGIQGRRCLTEGE
jgi:hypothetical protein